MRYIKKIILQNFQSHKYSVIELNEELNVIVGPSDSGKSAIIRGLKWALYNEPSGDYFIREGEREASVTVEFSDNIKVKRYRSKSKNSYHLFKRDGEEVIYEGFGTNVPQEIIDTIDIKKIQLDSDESVSVNLGEQLDGAFLLSEKTSVRASAIGRLVGVNVIDDALREGLKDSRNISTIRKNLDSTIVKIETELEKYDYLIELSKTIKKIEVIKADIQEKTDKYNKLKLLYNKLIQTNALIKENELYINEFKEIGNIDSLIINIQELYKKYKYYSNKKVIYTDVKLNIKKETNVVNKLVNLQLVNEKSILLSSLMIRVNNLDKLNNTILKYKSEHNICNNTIDKLKHISNMKDISTSIDNKLLKLLNLRKINITFLTNQGNINKGQIYMKNFDHVNKSNAIIEEIIVLNKRLILLQNIYNRYKIATTEIENVENTVTQNKLAIDNHLEKYGELLSKQEVCPFCLSHIDEEKVNHIIEHYK